MVLEAVREAVAISRCVQRRHSDNSAMTLPPTFDPARVLSIARETLAIEAQAVQAMSARLDERLVQAVQVLLQCHGRVVVMGMGKSGHVGRKIAATLASTGTPALFVHPAEASHGDLGMLTRSDLVLAISNSGEAQELILLLPWIKRMGLPLLAFCGRPRSTLAQHADLVLDTSVDKEACPHNLAPTASTTAQLALGDALAVALLDARGFKADDFARSHPGGALGRKLLTLVADVMRSGGDVPRVLPADSLMNTMREVSAKGLGMAAVTDEQGLPIGVFTDGDLRRLIEKTGSGVDLRQLTAADVMHPNPRTVPVHVLAVVAAELMESERIASLLVVDDAGRLCGAFNANDLMRARVI